jgi:hypothetical protein
VFQTTMNWKIQFCRRATFDYCLVLMLLAEHFGSDTRFRLYYELLSNSNVHFVSLSFLKVT